MTMTTLRCEVKGVSVGWNPEPDILTHVTFDLALDREVFIPVMGLSGEGKSTLLYVIAALKWPAAGTVRWSFPQRSFEWGEKGLPQYEATLLRRSYFGFAFQDSTLSPQLRVEENLDYPLMLQGEDSAEVRRRRVQQVLEDVQLENYARKFPHELSGGQRQRVALAQGMIDNPHVLFADEPGGNLDPQTRAEILQVLKSWVEKDSDSRAFVWITHNLDDADQLGSQTALHVDSGRCKVKNREWLEQCKEEKRLLP